jgi:hypothetical protein
MRSLNMARKQVWFIYSDFIFIDWYKR